MLEFKMIQELKPNEELLEIIKNYNYTIKNGKIKHLIATNLQFIEPTEYLITYQITLTILEYKVNEISNEEIKNLIYPIRWKQVMLDSDVVRLFNYQTKDLNRNVRNNMFIII